MINLTQNFDFFPYNLFNVYENMAIDETLLKSVANGTRKSVFRVYGWEKPAITLGYFQNSSQINLKQCKQFELPITRRITGGRAVFHHNDFTYSIILKGNEVDMIQKKKLFSQLSEIILEGLKTMGIKASLNSKTKGQLNNPNCFQSTSQCEIIDSQGKKRVGSALLIKDSCILNQGSIPLSHSYENISFFLKNSNLFTPQIKNFDIINNKLIQNQLNNFIEGIKNKIPLIASKLTIKEEKLKNELINNKYANELWILKR